MVIMHKYHGLGNDYLIFDPNENQITLQERDIERLCRRNFGVDSDGILYGPLFENNSIKVYMYHPDGREAEKNGNSFRVFAKYLKDAGYVTEQKFILKSKAGDTEVEFLEEEGNSIRVNMGRADFMRASVQAECISDKIELLSESLLFHGILYNTTCMSPGNPHCVIMTEAVSCSSVKAPGSYDGDASYSPNRMNLKLYRIESRNRLRAKPCEKDERDTMAREAAACAAAASAYRLGLVESQVTVEMPGGELLIEVGGEGDIFMAGPAEKAGSFTLAENFFS